MKCVIVSVDILKLDRFTLLWIVNLVLYFISVVTFSDADQCFMQIFYLFIQAYYDSETLSFTWKKLLQQFPLPSVLKRTGWHRLNTHLPIHFRKADVHRGMNFVSYLLIYSGKKWYLIVVFLEIVVCLQNLEKQPNSDMY